MACENAELARLVQAGRQSGVEEEDGEGGRVKEKKEIVETGKEKVKVKVRERKKRIK